MTDDASATERARQLSDEAQHLYSVTKRRKEALQAAKEHALAVTATAESRDGSVRVTVDAGGMLTDLAFTAEAPRADPTELARLVTTVTQLAAARAREAVDVVYEPLRGEGIVRGVPVLLPRPASVPKPPASQRRKDFEEEASFEERSVTRRRGRR